MSLLEVDSIDVAYGNVQVLWDVSLTVEEGETVALLGANGAGKTTTLKTICGDLATMDGEIRYKGESIGDLPHEEVVAKGVDHVPKAARCSPRVPFARTSNWARISIAVG